MKEERWNFALLWPVYINFSSMPKCMRNKLESSVTKEQPVSSYMEHASYAPPLTTSNYKSVCSCNSILYHKIIKYKEYKTNDAAIRRERRGH